MEHETGQVGASGRAFVPSASSQQAVSPVPASIPDAWLDPQVFQPSLYSDKPRDLPAQLGCELQEMLDKLEKHIAGLPEDRLKVLLAACMNVSPINCSWQKYSLAGLIIYSVQEEAAQAIEARRAATTGAVHESAVGSADASETSGPKTGGSHDSHD